MATFGDTNLYGVGSVLDNQIWGAVFTCPANGTGNFIKAGILVATATHKCKCAIYKHSDLSLVTNGATNEVSVPVQSPFIWTQFNFGTSPNFVSGTDYVLVAWAEDASGEAYLGRAAGDTDQTHYQSVAYNGFPNPLVPAHYDYTWSIYVDYTPSGGISIPVVMHNRRMQKMSVTELWRLNKPCPLL